jgi:hypothetical protein
MVRTILMVHASRGLLMTKATSPRFSFQFDVLRLLPVVCKVGALTLGKFNDDSRRKLFMCIGALTFVYP